MYTISKITKKRNSNFNLYIKDYVEEKIEIHIDILYHYSLHGGDTIDELELEELIQENEKKLAKQRALKVLSSSSKTRKEVINKLKEKRFSQDAIDYAMDFVDEYDFIDESNIAEQLVNGSYARKKYSKRMILSKLRQKGIDNEIANEFTEDINEDDEYENALYFAKKKLRSLAKKDKMEIKRKISSALSYRGFDYYVINKVIRDLLNDDIDDMVEF